MSTLADKFIPDDFAARGDIERRQAQLAVRAVFVIVPWGLISAVFVYWLRGSFTAALAVTIGPLVVAMAPLVLRRTGSLDLASLFILIPLYLSLSRWALESGGVLAPGTSWLLLLPLLALIFRGFKTSTFWLVLVLVTWVAMFIAGQAEWIATADLTGDRFPARRMIELFALSTTVFGLFYLKDSLQDWLIGAVEKREAETRAVVATAPDGILTIDATGRVKSANEAAACIFGRDLDELKGAEIQTLIPTLSVGESGIDDESMNSFGATEQHTGVCRGEEFPVEIAFGLLDEEQRDVVLVLRDITERKEAELELRQARDEALEASRAKSSFLANMSHELRTPLNAVIGYSEMINEDIQYMRESNEAGADVAARFVPDLERIESAGHHLLMLINDILDLSKIEAGKMNVHVEVVDLKDVIDDIVTTIRPLAKKSRNTIEVELDEELGMMRTDVTKMRQILFNLLNNSCKFTDQGSVRLEVSLDEDDDQIVFVVEDTGIGMTDDQMAEVFEAFRQADDSTTRKFGGTGLGLTITSHFCSLLGGDISVSSASGQGTRFTVRLARDLSSDADQAAAQEVADGERAPLAEMTGESNTETVLVVDDDPTVRALLRRMLEREGFDVVTAATGSEGLLMAEQIRPCAITLDVMMPSMDGWTMLSKLKENPELADLPVIMVTMLSEQSRGYALGSDHYLVKPVQRKELVDLLETYRSSGLQTGSILIVEDDEPTRSLMRRVLQKDGWQVTEAENGVEGLKALDDMTPSLVLLDLMMPKMDGFEFLNHFRQQQAYRDVPVVVVTAKDLSPEDEEKLNTNVTDVLAKAGTNTDQLLAEIRDMVTKAAGLN
jgi:PAS domain S-box-containing protein